MASSTTTASQEEAARARLPIGYRDQCSALVTTHAHALPPCPAAQPSQPTVRSAWLTFPAHTLKIKIKIKIKTGKIKLITQAFDTVE